MSHLFAPDPKASDSLYVQGPYEEEKGQLEAEGSWPLGQERKQGVQSGPLLESRVLKMGAVQAGSWGSGVVVGASVVLTGCKASGNCNRGEMVDPNEVMPFPTSCLVLRAGRSLTGFPGSWSPSH